MLKLKGIAASQGISYAKAYVFVEPDLTVKEVKIEDVAAEILSLIHIFFETPTIFPYFF